MRYSIVFNSLVICALVLQTTNLNAFQGQPTLKPEAIAGNITAGNITAGNITAENVMAAMEAEADGEFETRRRLLETAIKNGNSDVARWQLGQISLDGQAWSSIEECVALANESELLDEYRKTRSGYRDNVESNLLLAQQCLKENLLVQARAHLERVIDLDPDHQLARNILGYRRVGNEWISPRQMSRIAEAAALKQQSIIKYQKRIAKLTERMTSRSKRTREFAISELMELEEKDAVGAVEAAFATATYDPSIVAIDWMNQIDTVESSQVLARYSLMHPDPNVREYATSKLVTRPKHDFVPDMLSMLSSQISMMVIPSFDRNGVLISYRQAFAREDFEGKEFIAIDRGFQSVAVRMPTTTGGQTTGGQRMGGATAMSPIVRRAVQQSLDRQLELRIRQTASNEIQDRLGTMQEQNQQIEERNKLIAKVIAIVSQQPYTEDSKKMWRWWDNYNDTDYQTYKPERYQRETITTSVPRLFVNGGSSSMARRSGECFVAGTQVLTERGLRNIEDISTGDLVLSRNIDTGELNWNPVLRPTIRPPSATVNILVDGESFCCSTGHLFWVSGEGWKKASELTKNDVLHGAERPSLVTAVSPGEAIETHNLEVADNANYFVGQAMIMSHDVTPRQTNRQKVPGQSLLQFLQR